MVVTGKLGTSAAWKVSVCLPVCKYMFSIQMFVNFFHGHFCLTDD